MRAWLTRTTSGDAGALPVVLALVVIAVAFEVWTQGLFLSPGNLVNLFIESMIFMTLGISEVFVLLLGEIDLSTGYILAVGAAIAGIMVQKPGMDWPWWLVIIATIFLTGLTGAVWGTLVSRLHLPSFVVTLAGQLIMWGVTLEPSPSPAPSWSTSTCSIRSSGAASRRWRAGSFSRSSQWASLASLGRVTRADVAVGWSLRPLASPP